MRVIIAGSRDITDVAIVEMAIEASGFEITEVVSGGARGVDRIGEVWGLSRSIPCKVFLPRWDKYPGKQAGFVRNIEMAEYAAETDGALIAVWMNNSAGTRHMIKEANKRNLKVYVHEVKLQGENDGTGSTTE